MVEAAGIEPASAWLHTARVYVRSPVFVLAAGLASALAEPVASRVLSRPPPPDEDLGGAVRRSCTSQAQETLAPYLFDYGD